MPEQAAGQTGFAGAGWTDKDQVLGATYEVQTGEGLDLDFIDPGLLGEGKALQGPVPRHAGLFEAIGQAFFLTDPPLFEGQAIEEIGCRDGLFLGPVQFLVETVAHPLEVQFLQDLSEFLTHRNAPGSADRED